MILGIDEVGRGPWAGPLVIGAVVLGGAQIDGLDDSKKLTKKKRETLDIEIRQKASAVALGWVSASELDEVGMSEALRLATRRAVEQIHVPYHEIIIDGTINFLAGTAKGTYVTTLAKADGLIPSVSAASIIAKVARDQYMAEQDKAYPGYGFAAHAGYGVAKHREAIERLGVTPLHRLSFAPLQKYSNYPFTRKSDVLPMKPKRTTRAVGDASESVVAEFLVSKGHEILARNWRTKWCEIDIVSKLHDTLYFTEVKHRTRDTSGDGFAAITPRKQQQMTFAAEVYASHYPGYNLMLAAAMTEGEIPRLVTFLEIQ